MAAKGRRRKQKTGERVHLGFRVTPEMKQRIEKSAKAKGRSQSQEAEMLIEHALDRSDLLTEVLSLAYGPQLAGVLVLIGDAMKEAGEGAFSYGRLVPPRGTHWLNLPVSFDQSVKAANFVLEALRPPGEIKPIEHLPPMPIWPEGLVHELGEQRAIIVLRDVLRDAVSGWRTVASQPWQIRKLLGASLIERIRQSTPATAPEQSAKKRGERKDAK